MANEKKKFEEILRIASCLDNKDNLTPEELLDLIKVDPELLETAKYYVGFSDRIREAISEGWNNVPNEWVDEE